MVNEEHYVTERIEFTDGDQIDRALPTLLSDNAKMTVQVWEGFCDKVDAAAGTLGNIKMINYFLGAMIAALSIFASVGWQYGYNMNVYYGIISPLIGILVLLICNIEKSFRNKAASKISNVCSSTANHDRELSLKLISEGELKNWYIEVGLRNVSDLPTFLAEDNGDAPTAVPMGSPDPASDGPSPKKYVKDGYGKMTLNPEYKKWKQNNP